MDALAGADSESALKTGRAVNGCDPYTQGPAPRLEPMRIGRLLAEGLLLGLGVKRKIIGGLEALDLMSLLEEKGGLIFPSAQLQRVAHDAAVFEEKA